jgi:hypothetical protein
MRRAGDDERGARHGESSTGGVELGYREALEVDTLIAKGTRYFLGLLRVVPLVLTGLQDRDGSTGFEWHGRGFLSADVADARR